MNRLTRELHRLFDAAQAPAPWPRALVLEVARPADWQKLSAVWQGVQADLDLPAPAIAANGRDGLQLWFSLPAPVPPARADAFVEALCRRYLPELPAARRGRVAAQPPAEQGDSGHWSAFLAPDLAALFAETPWLDLPPNDEGQADLLARLRSITPAQFGAAEEALLPVGSIVMPVPVPVPAPVDAAAPAPDAQADEAALARAFLLAVMQDPGAPLAQRVEAARALLAAPRR